MSMLNSMVQINEVTALPYEIRLGLMGYSGAGKSSTIYAMLEKWVPGQYIILDTGMEGGLTTLEGARNITTGTWDDFLDAVNAIVIDKITGQANTLVVAIDTIDELQRMSEQHVLDEYNSSKSIVDQVENINDGGTLGYGQGLNTATTNILKQIKKLEDSGITVWQTFHSRLKDVENELSKETYKELTANLGQTTFNNFLTKLDVLGTIWTDIDLDTVETKNFIGETVRENKKVGETRVVTFRDTTSAVRSKSRYQEIDDMSILDADRIVDVLTRASIKATKLSEQDYNARRDKQLEEQKIVENDPRYANQRALRKRAMMESFYNQAVKLSNTELYKVSMENLTKKYGLENVAELYANDNVPVSELYTMLVKVVSRLGGKYTVSNFKSA